MVDWMKVPWLDEYQRKAQFVPGLIALLPIAIMILALGLRQQPVVAGIAGLLSVAGLPVLLTSTVRLQGKQLQERLWREWGGAPTTACLRHRGPAESAALREQWRRNVRESVSHSLPTAMEEEADPVGADGRYVAAIAEVKARSTDPLVFEENKNYGFERNLLAMRPFGLWVSAAGVAVGAASLVVAIVWDVNLSLPSVILGLFAEGVLLGIWAYVPSSDRVYRVGRSYAERLLDSLVRH